MNVDDLLILVPSLLTRVTGLELQLTKTNKKVKKLEHIVEELGIHITDSEDAESENSSKQGGIWLKQQKANPQRIQLLVHLDLKMQS